MHAAVIHETGGPEVLRYEEVPDPVPGDGEVLVRLEAIGVNHFDLNQRAGGASSFPLVLGGDGAGRRQDSGARVLVTGAVLGTYAELAAVPETAVYPIPDALDAVHAAALGVPYRTAWRSIVDMGGLEDGDTLLVQAGSSGTGQACVDLGRALGATVWATASASKHERLAALGAHALAYDDPRLPELGADVVYDPVGAETFGSSLAALAPDGRLVTPGGLGNTQISFNLWTLIGKRGHVIGISGSAVSRDALERIIEMAAAGQLRPAIDRELPLAQAAEAHRAIEARETFGKVILHP